MFRVDRVDGLFKSYSTDLPLNCWRIRYDAVGRSGWLVLAEEGEYLQARQFQTAPPQKGTGSLLYHGAVEFAKSRGLKLISDVDHRMSDQANVFWKKLEEKGHIERGEFFYTDTRTT